jgi:hypothetical protein
LKKIQIVGLAVVALLVAAAVAVAQSAPPTLTITESHITPSAGGSKKKPKNASAGISFAVNRESNSTADRIVFNLPTNLKLSGTGFKYCPASKINSPDPNEGGVANCPKGSKVGSGSAVAYAGSTRIDYTITIFAASKNEIAMNLAGNVTVPALQGIVSDAGSPFGQKITIDIPKQVQQPIGGLYSAITEVHAKIGPATGHKKVTKKVKRHGKTVKKKVTVPTYFASRTGCTTDKLQHYGVELRFVPNPNPPAQGGVEQTATEACTK